MPTIRASESVLELLEQPMAFFMSNGCTVFWGVDLKWKSLVACFLILTKNNQCASTTATKTRSGYSHEVQDWLH